MEHAKRIGLYGEVLQPSLTNGTQLRV